MGDSKTPDKECQACVAALWDILQAERGSRAFEAALKRGRQIYDKYREGPILDHGAYQVEMPKEVSSAREEIPQSLALEALRLMRNKGSYDVAIDSRVLKEYEGAYNLIQKLSLYVGEKK